MTPGGFIVTYTGREFPLARPRPSDVCIEDIAHGLSLINRFTGATRDRPYSVAEHSLLVVEILERDGNMADPMCLRAALLHDAHEAYCGDMATPVKRYAGAEWHALEGGIERAVAQHFGIEDAALRHRFVIKHADLVALATERRDLMAASGTAWPLIAGVQPVKWIDLRERAGMTWQDWERAFLMKHAELAHECDEQRKH
jgi:hypothetical protein